MKIPKEIINTIQNRASISDIIGQFVKLRKKGQNFFGLCPFHNDKNPSMSVSDEKKMFHCFACHESGNVFNFLMKFKNITFPQAVKEVAKTVGVTIEEKNFKSISKTERLDIIALRINKQAAEIYNSNLHKDNVGYKYLLSRGIDEHDIKRFKLGYAPNSWDYILKKLKNQCSFSEESIKHAQIVSTKENNVFDRFRNKIIFPIYNERDNVIAFGSRVLDNSQPKYINSPETNLFKKRSVLYGINLAKNNFRKKQYAIISEGYFDVIACHKFGFDTAVAPLGTALTLEHLYILQRYVKDIYLIFDGDDAGIRACLKTITLSADFDFNIKIVPLEQGLDPMDFLQKHGKSEFQKRLDKALSPDEFVITTMAKSVNLNSSSSRIAFIKNVYSFMRGLKNEILEDEFLKKLAEITNSDENSIRHEYKKRNTQKINVIKKTPDVKKENKLERQLLFTILANKNLFENTNHLIHADFFLDKFCYKAFKAASECYQENEEYDAEQIFSCIKSVLDNEDEIKYFSNEFFNEFHTKKPEVQYEQIMININLEKCRNRRKEIQTLIKKAQEANNVETATSLQDALIKCVKEENELKKDLQSVNKF